MWKSLVVLVIAANVFYITPSEATYKKCHDGKHCPSKCPKNETLDPCLSTCPPRYCGLNIAAISCAAIPPESCKPGCRCKDEYLRNADGFCIKEEDCPVCKNPNEVYDVCPAPCPPRRCDVDESLILCAVPPQPGDPECKPGCRCADGFVRNPDGVCVTRDQCPIKCPKNETLDPCLNTCPPRFCGVNIAAVSCAAVPPESCEPGCRCKDGYLRNADGFCIKEKDCPKCKNPNEVYDVCPAPCPPRRCDVDERVIRCAAPPKPGDPNCKPGCRCADGFVRNRNEVCVTKDKCPPPKCGRNEVISTCPIAVCRPQTCSEVGFPIACPFLPRGVCPTKPVCICDVGFVRNDTGPCIPATECPSCGGDPNAVSGCGVNCGKHCSERNNTEPVACILSCLLNGCDCREGLLLDDNTGKCVSPEKCTPTCGKDEVYSECINGGCEPKNCSQIGYPVPCIKIDPASCMKGCTCKEGYARADNGTCIPKNECPSCGGDPNAVSGCGVNCGNHCSDLISKEPVACIEICNINGCDCKEGFVVDDSTGICIRPEECVSCKGDVNAMPGCDKECKNRCPGPKPKQCRCPEDSCQCKDGFLYDPKTYKCVRPEQCTSVCGTNEVFSSCSNGGCGPWTCNDLGFRTGCIKMHPDNCKEGCICQEGFVRDTEGKCIPSTDCPECGGDPNAIAGCGINCGRLCSNWDKGPVACVAECIQNACDCRPDFVFDEITERCVLPINCTQCSKPNEVYDPCPPICPPQTCESIGKRYFCPMMPVNQTDCKGACRCKKGYLRNKIGECILEKDCPIVCGDNEIYSECINGGCQRKNCSQLGKPVPCIKIDPKDCKKGCLCAEGYLRATNGKCIPQDQCPSQCLKANEVYDPCPPTCPPQTCESIGKIYHCPLMLVNQTNCKGECRCKEGYRRNKIGECISEKDCLKCTGPHEYFSCSGACDNVCATLSKQNQTNCPIVNIVCNRKCYCEEGYARDENDICVPFNECPGQCGVNERWEICPDWLCTPQSCEELGCPLNCPPLPDDSSTPCPGPPACVCDFDFVRDKNGQCIPSKQCPSCGGDPNAVAGCGANCGRLCSNYYKGPIACPRICYPNACDCKPDYVFDEIIKKCVLPKQCTPVCGDNEVYSECINGGCQPKNCSQLGKPVPCVKIDPKDCKTGCLCVDGYLRASNGKCVPEDQCDQCNKPHEHYDPCASTCPPQTCESIGRQYKCPAKPLVCKGACRCDDGYLRNKIGECIARSNCLKCKGPNEYFSCGSECDNVCETLYKQNQTNCPIKNIKCKPMCYCQKGYARDSKNICIPIDECPVPICGENERFEQCPPSLCTPQDCSELGFPIACPDIPDAASCPEPPGCVCIADYVRDDNEICVPKNTCPSCGGDPNAVAGCGINCGRLCSNYKRTDVVCPALCNINGCDCREGFVYDENLGRCVRPKKCSPVCKENEVYDLCANGGCSKRNCSQLGQPDLCIDVIQCIGGCVCEPGFLRDDKGHCVPQNQCPTPSCGKNERFEMCPEALCEPQWCSELGFPVACPILSGTDSCPGSPACICDNGYVRNDKGVCIPKNKCPSCGGDPNAESGCGLNCGRLCSNYNKGPVPCPKICKFNSCDCKKDFVLDVNINKCVKPKQCTPVCGIDEVYSDCTNGGCQAKNCSQLGKPVPCVKIDPKDCKKGCLCKEGYLRTNNGICVPKDQCNPIKCGRNERLEQCPDSLCTPQTCSQLGFPIPCPALDNSSSVCSGPPRCVCDNDYVRNIKGKCVPRNECPSCGGDPNAVSGCGGHCGNRCSNYKNKPAICPLICFINSCDCKQGFVFDDNLSKCVRPKDCTQVCGNNEVYNTCANGGCQKRNCSQVNQPQLCIDPIKCIGGCVCQEGFLRAKNGSCIPENQCPAPVCGKNEVYDICANGGCDRRNCSQVGDRMLCIDPIKCVGGCVCQKGYLRRNDGVCIPEDQCPPKCTKPHEVYDPCAPICPPQTCDSIGKVYPCPLSTICKGACRCEDGYYRNKINECILKSDCLKCTGPNEYFSCGSACDNECATLKTQNQTNCPIKNKKCNPKCYCEKGYARDKNNVCIPIPQCGVSCNGDPNAVSGCGGYCGNRCSDYRKAVACTLACELNGCDCKQNYVYDDNLKKCVQPKDCSPICGKHEVYNGCINGGCQKKMCSDLGRPDICIDPKDCIQGCLCKKGWLRADNGTCVPISKCPTPTCPNPNEVFDTCANGGCNRRKCSELTGPIICRDPIECIGDCVCIKGFLRNQDGVCVPEDQCNPTCNRPNEVYSSCTYSCPPQTCESLDMAYICPIETGEEPPCESGCVCQEGFYRNKLGDCISEAECLQCMGPNEYFSCGGACDNVCLTLNEQSQDDCPIINIQCNRMCYCESGYARNSSKICIPIGDCPPSRCGPNERYEENPSKICEPLTCEEVGWQMECPPVDDPDCDDTPACICKFGLVRNKDGVCIPISECPATTEPPTTVNVTEARIRLNEGIFAFSTELVHELILSKPNENIIASCPSLFIPLALLSCYTKGVVKEQLFNLINLNNVEEIKAVFLELLQEFNNQQNVTLEIANIIYFNKKYELSDSFKGVAQDNFDAEAANLDFSQNVIAAKTINDWVDNRTHGKIQDLVSPNMLNADTRLVLINAIYFLGNWIHQFDVKKTKAMDFTKSNGDVVQVQMMYQQNTFRYAENDLFQAIELPYKGNTCSLLIVLPRTNDGLLTTVEYFKDPAQFNALQDKMSNEKCNLYLPKYKISLDIDLAEILKKNNVTEMFKSGNDGFYGILDKPEPLFVSNVIQKAFIEVNENGTEAAAATAIMVGTTSAMYPPPKVIDFKAIRSFIFYLLCGGEPLFCGAFVGAP